MAERDEMPPELRSRPRLRPVDLPAAGRFGLIARLRAGAILEDDWFNHVRRVVPVDSYAQFAVKLTVLMVPGTLAVNPTEAHFPGAPEFESHTNLEEHVTVLGLLKGLTAPVSAALAVAVAAAIAVLLALFVLPVAWPWVAALRRAFGRKAE